VVRSSCSDRFGYALDAVSAGVSPAGNAWLT
jgi:hypothetical protein